MFVIAHLAAARVRADKRNQVVFNLWCRLRATKGIENQEGKDLEEESIGPEVDIPATLKSFAVEGSA